MTTQRHMICSTCWILSVLFFMSGSTAFSPDYLSSLSKKTNTNEIIQQPTTPQTNDISNTNIQHEQQNNNMNTNENDTEIPDEHYSKDYPNAGWRGYANSQWGGYLDNLNSDTNQLEEGKKSDYGDDVRWGTEVYLNSIEKRE